MRLWLFFTMMDAYPHMVLAASAPLRRRAYGIFFYINYAWAVVCAVAVWVVDYRWVGESVVVPLLWLNHTLVLIPFVMHGIVVYALFWASPVHGDAADGRVLLGDAVNDALHIDDPD